MRADGLAGLWSVADNKRLAEFGGPADMVVGTQFSPAGRYLFVASKNATKLVDTASGGEVMSEPTSLGAVGQIRAAQSVSRNPVVQQTFLDADRGIVVGRENGNLEIWAEGLLPSFGMFGILPGFAPVVRMQHGTPLTDMAASADGSCLVSVGTGAGMTGMGTMVNDPTTVRVWQSRNAYEVARIIDSGLIRVALSTDGRLLATAERATRENAEAADVRIRLWRLPTSEHAVPLTHPSPPDRSPTAVSLDGRHIARRTENGALMLGDPGTTHEIGRTPPDQKTTGLRFSQDGQLLAETLGSAVYLYDTERAAWLSPIETASPVVATVLSRSGRFSHSRVSSRRRRQHLSPRRSWKCGRPQPARNASRLSATRSCVPSRRTGGSSSCRQCRTRRRRSRSPPPPRRPSKDGRSARKLCLSSPSRASTLRPP